MEYKDELKVEDKHGFIYEVVIKHFPQIGISTAYYNDDIIAQREYGRMLPPIGDDDREWEMFDERMEEWSADAITDLEPECKSYFNRRN